MKKLKTSTLVAAAAIALGLSAGAIGVTKAASTTGTNPMSNLVNAISQRFNLNANDVQQVFDQQRQQMDTQRQQAEKDRLAQAVTADQLTQAQSDQITAKQQELQTLRASLAGKTEDEKHTAMKDQMDSLKQWATDNSIPQEFLRPGGRGPRGPDREDGPGRNNGQE